MIEITNEQAIMAMTRQIEVSKLIPIICFSPLNFSWLRRDPILVPIKI